MIDPKKVAKAMQANEAKLIKLCIEFAEKNGLNEKHRFIIAPVRVEWMPAVKLVLIHRHADLTLIDGDKASVEKPRIIKYRVATLTTKVE